MTICQPDQQASAPGYSLEDFSLRMCSRAVSVALLCSSFIQDKCDRVLYSALHVDWARCDMKDLFKDVICIQLDP